MMPRILICYATKHGQTEKIARVLARELEAVGHPVDLFDVEHISPKIRVAAYEGVIVGAPVYSGAFPRHLRQWVRDHAKSMTARPGAFFSVSLGILETDRNVRRDQEEIVENFLAISDWEPKLWRIFAGAFNYSKSGWLARLRLQRAARRAGLPEDGHDREFTDWGAVSALADEFSSLLLERWPAATRSEHRELAPSEVRPEGF